MEFIKKIKDTSGGFHSWWQTDKGVFRKPNNFKQETIIEPKAEEEIKQNKIMPEKEYSFKTTLLKMVKYFVLFSIPFVIDILPNDVLNMTVGAILVGILNWVKVKFGLRIP